MPTFHVEYACGESSPTTYELSIPYEPNADIEIVINCCPNCTTFNENQFPESWFDGGLLGSAGGRRLLGDIARDPNAFLVSGDDGAMPEPEYYDRIAKKNTRRVFDPPRDKRQLQNKDRNNGDKP